MQRDLLTQKPSTEDEERFLKACERWSEGIDLYDKACEQDNYSTRQETLLLALEKYISALKMVYAHSDAMILEDVHTKHLLNVLKRLCKKEQGHSLATKKKYAPKKIKTLTKLLNIISKKERKLTAGEEELVAALYGVIASAQRDQVTSVSTIMIQEALNIQPNPPEKKRKGHETNNKEIASDLDIETAPLHRKPKGYRKRNMLVFPLKVEDFVEEKPSESTMQPIIYARNFAACYDTSLNRALKVLDLYYKPEQTIGLGPKEMKKFEKKFKINKIKKLSKLEFDNFKKNGLGLDFSFLGEQMHFVLSLISQEEYKQAIQELLNFQNTCRNPRTFLILLIYLADMHYYQLRQKSESALRKTRPYETEFDPQTELLKMDLEILRPKPNFFCAPHQQSTARELYYAATLFPHDTKRFPDPNKISSKFLRTDKVRNNAASTVLVSTHKNPPNENQAKRTRRVPQQKTEINSLEQLQQNLQRNPQVLKAAVSATVIAKFGQHAHVIQLLKNLELEELSIEKLSNASQLSSTVSPLKLLG